MVTPAQRMQQRRDGGPARAVQLSIDGASFTVVMTRAEQRQLRYRLDPYMRKARRVEPPSAQETQSATQLSDRLRQARAQALLGLAPPGLSPQPGNPLDGLVDRAAEVYAKALADETRATYRRRWLQFARWCEPRDLAALPASAEVVMLYLASLIDADPAPSLSTLRGRAAAINRVHVEFDLPVPGDDPALSMLMRGLSRTVPAKRHDEPMSALRIEQLRDVCSLLDHPDPVVVRDAAILHLSESCSRGGPGGRGPFPGRWLSASGCSYPRPSSSLRSAAPR